MTGNEEQTVVRIERLRFVELLLYFGGSVNRDDLINRFGISKATASNLLSAYGQLAPNNLTYNVRQKRYEIAPTFKAVFSGRMPTDRVPVYTIPKLHEPISDKEIEKLALISRAIQAGRSLSVDYTSASSGRTKREVVPVAFGDNLLRWHLRAFDRNRQRFSDFVLQRISNVVELYEDSIQPYEHPNSDTQWHAIVELKLRVHAENVDDAFSFAREGGVDSVKLRAAMAGYFLQLWNVDCSENAKLRGKQYQYLLENLAEVSEIADLTLAPGYREKA